MKLIISACVLILLLISGCAGTIPKQQSFSEKLNTNEPLYTLIDNSIPKIGEETEVYLGDRMLLQRTGMFKECIRPDFFASNTITIYHTYKIEHDKLICKNSPNGNFMPTYINYDGPATSRDKYNPAIITKNNENSYSLCIYDNFGQKVLCNENVTFNSLNYGAVFVYSEDSFQQVIEYNGKNGNILNFVYSEYSDGMARQAFTREFKIDLSEGNTVAYKGAILEIIEAGNTKIEYKVVRNFK